MGIAYAALQRDGVRSYHGLAIVEGAVIVAIITEGIAHLLTMGMVA
jgi:hypothetical protein